MVIKFFSPVGYRAVNVAIKGCNSLRVCFTQGLLTYQHGAGEVPQSQCIFSWAFLY